MSRWTPLVALALLTGGCATTGTTTLPSTTAPATTTTMAATTSPTAAPSQATIGMSREGRPIETVSFGSGPNRLYIVGGIHGDERPAVENVAALINELSQVPLEGWTVRIVLDANPDGTAANTRENASGVDLNRNWPTVGFIPSEATGPAPLSEPETIALASDIAEFTPDLIVALHAAREGPFVEYDGAAELPAAAFAAGASVPGREWEVVAEVDWVTEGSLGTHFGKEGRIPVVTVEFNRWDSPAGVTAELLAGTTGLLDGQPGGAVPTCAGHRAGMTCGLLAEAAHEVLHAGTTGGAHGLIIKEVGGPVHAALHPDTAFYPASVIKLAHMAHALRTSTPDDHPVAMVFEDGCRGSGPGVERPVYDLLAAMMQESDNAAANALQTRFGLEALSATIDGAGMTATRLVHGFGCGGPANDPANRTTAVDLIHLLESIADGTLVPGDRWPLVEELMIDVTRATGFDPATGAVVLAKDGWYGTTLTLGGIAKIPTEEGTRTFVFAAFTEGAALVDPSFTILSVARALLDPWSGA